MNLTLVFLALLVSLLIFALFYKRVKITHVSEDGKRMSKVIWMKKSELNSMMAKGEQK